MENPLTERMVRNIVLTWYASTNVHRPVEELECLLDEKVEMRYPNQAAPLIGKAAFRTWYADVLDRYFDETHEVESWNIDLDGRNASAVVIVRWEARSWRRGEARSRYEAHLSRQRFGIERSEADGRARITLKFVETFEKTAPIMEAWR